MYEEFGIREKAFRTRKEPADIREVRARVRCTVRKNDEHNRALGATDQQTEILFRLLNSITPEGVTPQDWLTAIFSFFGYDPNDLGVVEAQAMISWLCPPDEERVGDAAAWEALAIYNTVTRAAAMAQHKQSM
jgi:hypothetical protein